MIDDSERATGVDHQIHPVVIAVGQRSRARGQLGGDGLQIEINRLGLFGFKLSLPQVAEEMVEELVQPPPHVVLVEGEAAGD